MRRAHVWLVVIAVLCCQPDSRTQSATVGNVAIRSTDQDVVAWIEADRSVEEQLKSQAIVPSKVLQLPDSMDRFEFGLPTAIDARGMGTCRIAAADASDDAIHMFGLDGSYIESLYGGIADTSAITNVTAVSLRSRMLAAADVTEQTVSVYEDYSTRVRTLHVPSPISVAPNTPVFGSEIALAKDGILAEHWIESSRAVTDTAPWSNNIPVVRLWYGGNGEFSGRGRLLRGAGTLTPLFNQGKLIADNDTVWFGRRSDGRLLGFSTSGTATAAARVIEPPILFRAETPVEVLDDDGRTVDAAAPYHLIDFSIAPSGRFFVLQSDSFPELPRTVAELREFRDAGVEYRPRSVLVVLDRAGDILAAYRVDPYDPWEITVTETVIVLLALDELRTRRVLVFDNPMAIDHIANAERQSCL